MAQGNVVDLLAPLASPASPEVGGSPIDALPHAAYRGRLPCPMRGAAILLGNWSAAPVLKGSGRLLQTITTNEGIGAAATSLGNRMVHRS